MRLKAVWTVPLICPFLQGAKAWFAVLKRRSVHSLKGRHLGESCKSLIYSILGLRCNRLSILTLGCTSLRAVEEEAFQTRQAAENGQDFGYDIGVHNSAH